MSKNKIDQLKEKEDELLGKIEAEEGALKSKAIQIGGIVLVAGLSLFVAYRIARRFIKSETPIDLPQTANITQVPYNPTGSNVIKIITEPQASKSGSGGWLWPAIGSAVLSLAVTLARQAIDKINPFDEPTKP